MNRSAGICVHLRPLPCIVTALTVVVGTAKVVAQSPRQRVAIEAFRDSLNAVTDTLALRRLERALDQHPADSADRALIDMHRGLVRLRLGELSDGRYYGRAASSFDQAADYRPAWPWPWYARGLAKVAEGRWFAAEPLNLGTRVGYGSLRDAAESFGRAVELAPEFSPPLIELTRTAFNLRDTTLLATLALRAARRAATALGRDPDALFTRGRVERSVGDPDSAIAAFRSYLAVGGNPGLGRLELARSEFVHGSLEGGALYYEGARYDDSATVAAYRADLALIEGDSILGQFDGDQGAERVAFLRRFWSDRDRLEMRDPGERLREHYRRIEYASRHYPLITNRRVYSWVDAYQSHSREFDDRGVIYIRQGEPDDRVLTPLFGIMPNETWRYRRADGDLLFHFRAGGTETGDWTEGGDIQDYRLVGTIFAFTNQWVDTSWLLASRCQIWELYCRISGRGPEGQLRAREEELRALAASIEIGTTSDAFELRFARPLPAEADVVVVGRAGERSLAHVVYAIPVQAPDSMPQGEELRLPVRLRFVAWDAVGHPVASFDSTAEVILSPPLLAQPTARGRFEVPLPPGVWFYRMALQVDPATGRIFPRESLRVGRFGAALAVSDLVLGSRLKGVVWVPSLADTARFQAETGFRREEPLDLYYEVYGLAAAEEFRTELTLHRGKKAALTLGFVEHGAQPVTRSSRTVSLMSLKPGRYTLEVRVIRANGESVSASRAIDVVSGKQ